MTDQYFMKLAIREARKAAEKGWTPLGVVIVKDDQVLTSGTSHVGEKMDPAAHGEIWCMTKACQKQQSLSLTGCTLYSTLEPCSMCLGCAGWTGLSRIVFGAYQEDVPSCHYELNDYAAEEHAKKFTNLAITGGVLREDCKELMRNVKNWKLEMS